MLRFVCPVLSSAAALTLLLGVGTATAGVLDVLKAGGAKLQGAVVRGQEPSPAPPAPLDVPEDPAYAQPTTPAPAQTPMFLNPPGQDCAPAYAGLSGCDCYPICAACREPTSKCEKWEIRHTKAKRKLCGDSWYCDGPPLFGPRYGYHTTCWRRLPEDCRCPIYLPPKKSAQVSQPIPTEPTEAKPSEVPPPPQALNLP